MWANNQGAGGMPGMGDMSSMMGGAGGVSRHSLYYLNNHLQDM